MLSLARLVFLVDDMGSRKMALSEVGVAGERRYGAELCFLPVESSYFAKRSALMTNFLAQTIFRPMVCYSELIAAKICGSGFI